MTNSYLSSLILHTLALGLLGFVLSLKPPTSEGPPTAVVARPMRVTPRPSLPRMVRGDKSVQGPVASTRIATPVSSPPKTPIKPTTEIVTKGPTATEKSAGTPKRPQLTLPEPAYPTRPNTGSGVGPGQDPIDQEGDNESEDRDAIPWYRPAPQEEAQEGRGWVLVKFRVSANGRCKVEMIDGTGDIHRDARILYVLGQWKWLPLRIDGIEYDSIQIRKLYTHIIPNR